MCRKSKKLNHWNSPSDAYWSANTCSEQIVETAIALIAGFGSFKSRFKVFTANSPTSGSLYSPRGFFLQDPWPGTLWNAHL